MHQIHVKVVTQRRRNKHLKEVICRLAIDSRGKKSQAIKDTPAVGVDGKDGATERVQHDTTGCFGADAWKAAKEVLDPFVAHAAERLKCGRAEGINNGDDLGAQAPKLDYSHAGAVQHRKKVRILDFQEPFPFAVHRSTQLFIDAKIGAFTRSD